jgi:hypothetical protein
METDSYAKMLAHLIAMAQQPGFKAHAWHRAKALDSDISGIYRGIKDDLVKFMADQKQSSVEISSNLG